MCALFLGNAKAAKQMADIELPDDCNPYQEDKDKHK